ncbi:hypothetical protein PDK93_28185 [Bacillus cereus]|nr:hypothetical protein [Bacillus cereus]
MNIQQTYGTQIWRFIKKTAAKYSSFPEGEIIPETYTVTLFNPDTDDGKDRFGQVLFDTFEYIKEISGKELKIDYLPRTEFTKFNQIRDIWIYFINRLEDLEEQSKEDNIVRFPTRP